MQTKIPSGFAPADIMQERTYIAKGYVPGATKLLEIAGGELCVRLGPPKYDDTLKARPLIKPELQRLGLEGEAAVAWYKDEYNKGWAAARRETSRAWEDGTSSHAFDDGYLDQAAGRPKWHLAHCVDHDHCGEG